MNDEIKKPENPPAFPLVVGTPSDSWGMQNDGMTLRDYFAGQCIGHLSAIAKGALTDGGSLIEAMATLSYLIADAMLKARQSHAN